MDVPQNIDKGQVSRTQWIQDDINQITQTVNMLSSSDADVVEQGLQSVSTILPFLMMGGFTLSEITAYLKAKKQAATDSLEQVKAKEEEEESIVEATTTTERAATKSQTMAAEVPMPGSPPVKPDGRKELPTEQEEKFFPEEPAAASGQDVQDIPEENEEKPELKDLADEV